MNKMVLHTTRIFLGVIFFYAGLLKIIDPILFSSQIHNYGVTVSLLEYFENLIALTLPWVEVLIGIGLIFKIKYKAALDIAIFLMMLFIILIGQAYLRGKSIDCGCFANEIKIEEWQKVKQHMVDRIIQDISWLLLLFILKYHPSNKDINEK